LLLCNFLILRSGFAFLLLPSPFVSLCLCPSAPFFDSRVTNHESREKVLKKCQKGAKSRSKGIKRRQFLPKSGQFLPIFAKKWSTFAKKPFIFRNFSQFYAVFWAFFRV